MWGSKANEIRAAHKYGVMYAVQFRSDELRDLDGYGSMGVKSFTLIMPDRLLAKMHVPSTYVQHPFTKDLDLLFDLPSWNGILAALRSGAPDDDKRKEGRPARV